MIDLPSRPLLLVVSAPSGAGKTTLCRRLLAAQENMVYSISCTTRSPRPGETDGIHYHFMSPDVFERDCRAGAFLEYAEVHGHRYGTLRRNVLDQLAAGRDVLMDIDVQGASQLRETIAAAAPDDPLRRGFVDVFIAPPSLAILRSRLEGRAQDAPDVIAHRLAAADRELRRWSEYAYLIVNDRLDDAAAALVAIVLAERCRVLTKPLPNCLPL